MDSLKTDQRLVASGRFYIEFSIFRITWQGRYIDVQCICLPIVLWIEFYSRNSIKRLLRTVAFQEPYQLYCTSNVNKFRFNFLYVVRRYQPFWLPYSWGGNKVCLCNCVQLCMHVCTQAPNTLVIFVVFVQKRFFYLSDDIESRI